MLSQLNICLTTPTPPPSRSTTSAPKTPYNTRQLDKQASTIKKLLRHRTQSPPSPTKTALNQLVKGFEIALNGAAILAKENQDLRAAHEKKLQKSKRSKAQIASAEGLSIEEGHALVQNRNQVEEDIQTGPIPNAPDTLQRRVRAPPRCSDCHTLGHRRLQCPNHGSI